MDIRKKSKCNLIQDEHAELFGHLKDTLTMSWRDSFVTPTGTSVKQNVKIFASARVDSPVVLPHMIIWEKNVILVKKIAFLSQTHLLFSKAPTILKISANHVSSVLVFMILLLVRTISRSDQVWLYTADARPVPHLHRQVSRGLQRFFLSPSLHPGERLQLSVLFISLRGTCWKVKQIIIFDEKPVIFHC